MRKSSTKLLEIATMSLPATTAMTLFSHGLSRITKERLTEPVLLNKFLHKKAKHAPIGYVIHYLVGMCFSIIYRPLWKNINRLTYMHGLGYGFLSGITGIAGWAMTFKVKVNPPKTNLGLYFAQLLAAHIVFGLVNCLLYRRIKKISR